MEKLLGAQGVPPPPPDSAQLRTVHEGDISDLQILHFGVFSVKKQVCILAGS